ncbi:MAG TPA: DHH family phosphoesterase [Candidatus Bathyarchaeota archaeon]|nr:DHH family phosphoesterase [Candidatus Bathyarchaeota archaeon]
MREFLNYIVEISSRFDETLKGPVLIVTHYDSDGLSAGSIMAMTLYKLDIPFHLTVVSQLTESVLKNLPKYPYVVFTDLGSGYLGVVSKAIKTNVLILDHHIPSGAEAEKRILHINPHLFNLDGATEVSGAGVTYFFSKMLLGADGWLASLAVIGALGDLQDKNRERKLKGLNSLIVNDAEEAGYLQVEEDLIFFGRETKPIHKAISSSIEPYIPGLSGREDLVLQLLIKNGIEVMSEERWRVLSDLSPEEKEKVFAAILDHMISLGIDISQVPPLIGHVYTLVREARLSPLRDCREFSALLNSCGKLNRHGLAVAVCLGERGSLFREALELSSTYKKTLGEALEKVVSIPGGIQDRGSFLLIRGEGLVDERLISSLVSILSTSPPYNVDKPLIGYTSIDEKNYKISARSSNPKLNLSRIIGKASESVSGMGGGHEMAAGAIIPKKKFQLFLKNVERLLST